MASEDSAGFTTADKIQPETIADLKQRIQDQDIFIDKVLQNNDELRAKAESKKDAKEPANQKSWMSYEQYLDLMAKLDGITQEQSELRKLAEQIKRDNADNAALQEDWKLAKANILSQKKDIEELNANKECQGKALELLLDQLNDLKAIVKGNNDKAKGKKTGARADKIRTILKAHGGSLTFKTLQKELQLKPNQFSRLVSNLDKRCFEVGKRPGATKEKVLILKVRIMDPIQVKR